MRTRFGEFIFDSGTRELTFRGEPRRLSPKAFLLLETLIVEAPAALSKNDLYRRVWGNTYVEEANLPNLISEIRAAMGETRQSAQFIRTIHGYGYAFAGELKQEGDRAAVAPRLFYLQWRRHEFPLRIGENIVGRGEESDVMIDSGAVSRLHARITVNAAETLVEDLGSKNGTFVRDQRVTGPTAVQNGDEIRFGVVAVVFRAVDRTASTMTGMPC